MVALGDRQQTCRHFKFPGLTPTHSMRDLKGENIFVKQTSNFILIAGSHSSIIIFLTAHYLAISNCHINLILDTSDPISQTECQALVSGAIRKIDTTRTADEANLMAQTRVTYTVNASDTQDLALATDNDLVQNQLDLFWFISSPRQDAFAVNTLQTDSLLAQRIFSQAAFTSSTEIIYASSLYLAKHQSFKPETDSFSALETSNGMPAYSELDAKFTHYCHNHGIKLTKFYIPDVFVETLYHPVFAQTGFAFLLETLLATKQEIEDKASKYFQHYPLSCSLPDDIAFNILPVELTTQTMLDVAAQHNVSGRGYHIFSPVTISIRQLCKMINHSWGLALSLAQKHSELNAIDRYFEAKIAGFFPSLKVDAYVAAGAPDLPVKEVDFVFDDAAQTSFLQTYHQNKRDYSQAETNRQTLLLNTLKWKNIHSKSLSLSYASVGNNNELTPIVIFNAFGMGTQFWFKLIEKLMGQHRVIVWNMPGTGAHDPILTLSDQLDIVEDIMRTENLKSYHILGWCTGGKLAVSYYHRHPDSVKSLILLHGAFRHAEWPKEYNSSYENNLDVLCNALVRQPHMASRLMQIFLPDVSQDNSELYEEKDQNLLAQKIMSLPHLELLEEVRQPFINPETLTRYAKQLVDFWSHNEIPNARNVQVPVLCLGAEYDQIVSLRGLKTAVEKIPFVKYKEISGATHYSMYERPHLIANLICEFLSDPQICITKVA